MAKKLKTHKGVAKRFKITGRKKIIHDKAARNHLLTNKNSGKKAFKFGRSVHKSDMDRIIFLTPYSIK